MCKCLQYFLGTTASERRLTVQAGWRAEVLSLGMWQYICAISDSFSINKCCWPLLQRVWWGLLTWLS